MKTRAQTQVVVIDAEGTFGDFATVWYAGSLEQAETFARRGKCQVLIGCEKSKGAKISRAVIDEMISAGHWRRA